MSNLSDKDIDRLSREAADSYEPDSGSLSWNRLEQMLTEQMPERPPDLFRFGRINPYIWGPAALLVAGLSFYLIKSKLYSKDFTPEKNTAAQQIKPAAAPVAEPETITGTASSVSPGRVHDPVASGETSAEAIRQKDRENASLSAAKLNNPDPNVLDKEHTAKNANAYQKNRNPQHNSRSSWSGALLASGAAASYSSREGLSENGNAGGKSASENNGIGSDLLATNRIPASLPPLNLSNSALGIVHGNDALLRSSGVKTKTAPNKMLRTNRSLNVGLAFGPDYTDAGGISNNQFGNNIGITVGYYVTNKLSVNTGAFYSNKFFWSPGYSPVGPPSGSNPQTTVVPFAAPAIEYINGSINLYEVPLTLRYDFAQNKKSKFFANAGLSSYFIVSQTYIHFLHTSGRPTAIKITDHSPENYWFGVGTFSVGMETDIGKGFSFQAEPFLKIPFQRMGMENVKLNSYGFLLSFRYAPVLGRSKK